MSISQDTLKQAGGNEKARATAINYATWCDQFSKVNHLVLGRHMPVQVEKTQPGVISYTDFRKIVWGTQMIEKAVATDASLLPGMLKGLDFHELGHIIFTPDSSTRIAQWANGVHKWPIVNLLEDARIEMAMLSLYPMLKPYFTLVVNTFIGEMPANECHSHLWGRKYLPLDIREEVMGLYDRKAGWFDNSAQEIADAIDAWMRLDPNNPSGKNFVRMQKIVNSLKVNSSNQDEGRMCACEGHAGAGGASIPEGMLKRAQKAAAAAAEGAGGAMPDDDDEDEEDEEDGPGGSEKGDGTEGPEGQSEGGDDDEYDESDRARQTGRKSKGKDKGAGGHGIGRGKATHQGSFKSRLAEFTEDAMSDPYVQSEMTDLLMQHHRTYERNLQKLFAPDPHWNDMPVPEDVKFVATAIAAELKALRHDMVPEWQRRHTTGRVNVMRFHDAPLGAVDLFDQWTEGLEEDASVEAVILVDMSGSMSGHMPEASALMWATKRALDVNEIPTTCIGYDDRQAFRLYRREELVKPGTYRSFMAGGGTDPSNAIFEARKILLSSEAKHRLLVGITDGGWQKQAENSAAIHALSAMDGVVTALFGIGGRTGLASDKRGHQFAADTDSLAVVPQFVRNTIVRIMRNVMTRRG